MYTSFPCFTRFYFNMTEMWARSVTVTVSAYTSEAHVPVKLNPQAIMLSVFHSNLKFFYKSACPGDLSIEPPGRSSVPTTWVGLCRVSCLWYTDN